MNKPLFIKIYVLGFACGIVASFVFHTLWQKSSSNSQAQALQKALIQSCHASEVFDGARYIYTNAMFHFRLSYPKDFMVCSQSDEADILLFHRERAFSDSPSVVININLPIPENHPAQTTISEEKTMIGGIAATAKKVRPASCTDDSCINTVYEFTKDGNRFSIWEREHVEGLLDGFTFL